LDEGRGRIAGRIAQWWMRNASVEQHPQRQVQQGPPQQCSPPAEGSLHRHAEGPANGTRKARDQGDSCDRLARPSSIETHQGSEGSIVESKAHRDADYEPRTKKADAALGRSEQDQSEGKERIGKRQHRTPAVPVNQPPGAWSEECGHQQGHTEAEVHLRRIGPEVGSDRCSEYCRQVVRRGPGKGLRSTNDEHRWKGIHP